MTVAQANVDWVKDAFAGRLGDDYVYGGVYSPSNARQGCDCSGLVGWVLEALTKGPQNMSWAHNVSTESWPYDYRTDTPAAPGTVGPYGTISVGANPAAIPADAALTINIMHGGGGEDSHTNCILQGEIMESNGSDGSCTNGTGGADANNREWTDHWFLPGPIVGGTPAPNVDTFWADVSEFQVPVDDSYPYQVISIRSNDGTYQDHHFAQNYRWCVDAADSGRLACFIVYCYWRSNWQDTAATLINMVNAQGGPHPKMVAMIDVESGGNPSGDQSSWINGTWMNLAQWLGNPKRVIGYGNTGDLNSLWPNKPHDEFLIVAGYGSDPSYPNKIGHQYTDGQVGAGQGLPMGCAPFGNCDMNVADGLSPDDFAAACGIGDDNFLMALTAQQQQDLYDKIMAYPGVPGIGGKWPSRSIYRGDNNGVDDTVGMLLNIDATTFDLLTEWQALMGVPEAVARVKALSEGQGPCGADQSAVARAKFVLSKIPTTE